MRISALLLAPVALLGLTISAQAADITYNVVNGFFQPPAGGGSFSGSFFFNPSTNIIDGGTFSVIAPSGGPTYSFSSTTSGTVPGSETFTDLTGDIFRLNLHFDPLGNLAINVYSDFGPGGDTYFQPPTGLRYEASGGQVVSPTTAATPEPSSLLLLGTGALGVAASFRRRLVG